MSEQQVWQAINLMDANDVPWIATRSIEAAVAGVFRRKPLLEFSEFPSDGDALVVIGGGTLIDRAKVWRHTARPDVRLIAVPTIWGSGAEVSPIAVLNKPFGKEIFVDAALVPDVRVEWNSLALTLDDTLVRNACGDTFSHALEAFLSPVAPLETRAAAAQLLSEMQDVPIANDERWFELSRQACLLQAASSVGLVHGIAHELEPILASDKTVGNHAALCSTFALPVFDFNCATSDKTSRYCAQYKIDVNALRASLSKVHLPERYAQVKPVLMSAWPKVIRNACSRTNVALVRQSGLEFFASWQAQ